MANDSGKAIRSALMTAHAVHNQNDEVEGDDRTGYKDGGKINKAGEWEEAPTPQKTIKSYKLFRRLKNGKLYPLFVHRTREVPIGKWLAAEEGKPGEKGGVQSSLGELAFRPGWHSGTAPRASHIGGISTKNKSHPVNYRPYEHVWAEVEHPADVDVQSEANANARTMANGQPDPSTAHITDRVPHGGTYNYTTNPNNPDSWMISGGMRVNRVLGDDEVKALNQQQGAQPDLPRLHEMDPSQLHPSLRQTAALQGASPPRAKRDAGGQLITPPAPQIVKPPVDLSGYQDAPAQKLHDMPWRPLADVHADLGHMSEIPSHVQDFGHFMNETADKAASKGLTPRDLIKAYAITRSSMGRGALPRRTLEANGWQMPEGVDSLRPEGAMGEWLHTPMGQEYLHHAERGKVHAGAIADAVQKFRPFGKQNDTEGKGLQWAAENLPGMEGHVSKMVQASRHKDANPAMWRQFIKGVPGVNIAKAGFLGSMMGMGNQPTLDARQIILNTGKPTSEATKPMSRVGGAEQAVDRLAARQRALKLGIPEELEPYYQHLAHHAIWDKAAGEQTTHQDLMHAMRHAKDGGRIGRDFGGGAPGAPPPAAPTGGASGGLWTPKSPLSGHEMTHAMMSSGIFQPSELWGGKGDTDVQQYLQNTPSMTSANPDMVRQALDIAQKTHAVHPNFDSDMGQSYLNFKGDKQPIGQMQSTVAPIPGVTTKPVKNLEWEDFLKRNQGAHLINLGGDRSRLGRLTHIGGKKLGWDVDLHAGHDYMREPNKGAVWANAPGASTRIDNLVKELGEKGDVYGYFSPMGPKSVDSSVQMTDAVMSQLHANPLDRKVADQLSDLLKSGAFVTGNKAEDVENRAKAAESMQHFPGIHNAVEARDFMRDKLSGADRSLIMKYLDKAGWHQKGVPHIGKTRVAITHPDLLHLPGNMLGPRIVKLTGGSPTPSHFEHNTYKETTGGQYEGDLPPVLRHYALPDVVRDFVRNPRKGRVMHPMSADDKARSGWNKMTTEQKVIQPINEEMMAGVAHGLNVQKHLKALGLSGYKKGGKTLVQPPQQDDTVAKALRLTAQRGR